MNQKLEHSDWSDAHDDLFRDLQIGLGDVKQGRTKQLAVAMQEIRDHRKEQHAFPDKEVISGNSKHSLRASSQ